MGLDAPMNHHRSLLGWLFTLILGVVLYGGGCANGGSAQVSGDDGGPVDGTAAVTDGGDAGDAGGCTGGKTKCAGTCTSTGTDPKNCGKCGTVCAANQVCSQGMCAAGCSGGETLCGGRSDAGAVDSGGGGDSGGAVEAGAGTGDGGVEASTPADAGTGTPDAGAGDGGSTAPYCASLNNDPSNCGACGFSCGTNGVCANGVCTLSCPSGQKGCPASGTCIPDGTCCQSGECTITGEVCPMPGGKCACPSGERECTTGLMSCISNDACCSNADCTVAGQLCTTPGQPCACKAGFQCCVASDCPTVPHETGTTCTANKCDIGPCAAGCYDLDNQFADGCECCNSIYGKSCATATAGGALTVGQVLPAYTGTIPETGGVAVGDWFAVTFSGEGNTAFHAHIQLTTGGGEFVFDIVQGSCGGAPLGCGEGGACTSKTDWEESYVGPSPPGDPNSTTPAGVSNFTPIGAVGTVFIHVYRANAAAVATCNPYTLTIQE